MKLLLDTHIWLWAHLAPERLGESVRSALVSPATELWLSPASIWEATLLADRGRMQFPPTPREWMEDALRRTPMRDARFSRVVALEMPTLKLRSRDPGDRILVATARALDLTLVTADKKIIESNLVDVLASQ